MGVFSRQSKTALVRDEWNGWVGAHAPVELLVIKRIPIIL